jgi:hypothetical protein
MGFEVLTAVVINVYNFKDVEPCSPYVSQQPVTCRFLAWLILDPEDGGDIFPRNICSHTDYTAL